MTFCGWVCCIFWGMVWHGWWKKGWILMLFAVGEVELEKLVCFLDVKNFSADPPGETSFQIWDWFVELRSLGMDKEKGKKDRRMHLDVHLQANANNSQLGSLVPFSIGNFHWASDWHLFWSWDLRSPHLEAFKTKTNCFFCKNEKTDPSMVYWIFFNTLAGEKDVGL